MFSGHGQNFPKSGRPQVFLAPEGLMNPGGGAVELHGRHIEPIRDLPYLIEAFQATHERPEVGSVPKSLRQLLDGRGGQPFGSDRGKKVLRGGALFLRKDGPEATPQYTAVGRLQIASRRVPR